MQSRGRVLPFVLAAACIVALVGGCGSGSDSTGNSEAGKSIVAEEAGSVAHVPTRWASGNARDLRTLISSTGTVFIGEVVSLKGQRVHSPVFDGTTADDGSEKPVLRSVAIPTSQFEVLVERSLAGGLTEGASVTVEQVFGTVAGGEGSETTVILEGDEPLQVRTRYLFFASRKPNGALASPPFARFTVRDGSLAPLSAWGNLPAVELLSGLSVEQASNEVRSIVR